MKKLLNPFVFFQQQIKKLFVDGSFLEKFLFFFYVAAFFGLFLYSYTQIDLGLVITRIPRLYAIEKLFQYVGYFNRPLSTELFICLAVIFLILYFFVLRLTNQKKVRPYAIWSIIGASVIILTFSYNAFSYDLFNYIFDAKILVHYHQNPYLHKALDYPKDPMLGFMHWTDRSYPYGPLWLVLTIPLSFIGSNIFIVTFFLFKLLISTSFLVSIYYLYRILLKVNESKAVENLILFALNPLVLFECLVSSHNDIVMMTFAIVSLFYLTHKRYWLSISLLIISIGLKFATIALIPVFIVILFRQFKNLDEHKDRLFQLCFAVMLFPLLLVTVRTTFQPWYFLYILPFLPFVTNRVIRYSFILVTSACIFLYIPFLATGDWHSIWYTFSEEIVYWIILCGVILSSLYLVYLISKMFKFKFRFVYNK